MASPSHRRPSVEDDENDDDSYSSESSFSVSQSAYSSDGEGEGSISGSASSGGSVDSVGRMLVQLEESDPSLTELTVDCTTIDREAATYVEQFIHGNTCVEKLKIRCGDRSSHRQTLRKVLTGLQGSSSIKCVEIQDADANRELAGMLVPAFAHSQLKHIKMMNCNFVGSGLGMLFVAMQHNIHIRELAFHSCGWEGHNVDIIASSLQFMKLHSLTLVDVNIPMEGWPHLFRNLEECKEIVHLNLSQCKMDADTIRMLAKCIKAQNCISKLSLSSCELDDTCMKELSRGLRTYSTLTSMDISRNQNMTDRGVVYLKDLIKFNKQMSELKVGGCGLSDQSMEAIESGLRYNNSFLKSFFSEKTSQAIFDVVDTIEKMDIGEEARNITGNMVEAVSFDSESSPRKKEEGNASALRMPRAQQRHRRKQQPPKTQWPAPRTTPDRTPRNASVDQNSAGLKEGQVEISAGGLKEGQVATSPGGQRRMLL